MYFKDMGADESVNAKHSSLLKETGKDIGAKASIIKKFLMKTSVDESEDGCDSGGIGRDGRDGRDIVLVKEDSNTVVESSVDLNMDKLPVVVDSSGAINSPSVFPVYYELLVKLKEGQNLAIRDIGG